ncbi:MAG TPA: hypothetical protein VGF16_12680 [Bryobacteraceae bacterium]|jgi:hypothetical protein
MNFRIWLISALSASADSSSMIIASSWSAPRRMKRSPFIQLHMNLARLIPRPMSPSCADQIHINQRHRGAQSFLCKQPLTAALSASSKHRWFSRVKS